MNPTDRASLEHFVRADLGCKCPDEVFDSIVIERDRAPDPSSHCVRLVIGNRLLVYVFEGAPGSAAAETLASLAARGPAERDARGFNRFRLIMASDRPAEMQEQARESFARIAGHDERAHLHVLSVDQLPHALRRT